MILKGRDERDWREMRTHQALVYSLAQLMGHSYHEPRKMPAFDKAFPDRKPKAPEDPAQIMRAMKMWTVVLGGKK